MDIVPILYDGDLNWYGNLVSQEDGTFLRTSIPRHLEFASVRKKRHDKDYAQVVRWAKFWARRMKNEHDGFRFKSFMIEMIMSKLSDDGVRFSDYPDALQAFFSYIARSDMREQIAFADYYCLTTVQISSDPIQIIDPVNQDNNVARLYSGSQADAIVDAALDAGDAIAAALRAPTKQQTVAYWQKVFGPQFQV